MVNRPICDICGKVIWDDNYEPTKLGLLANINDACSTCWHDISEYAKKLKKQYEDNNKENGE